MSDAGLRGFQAHLCNNPGPFTYVGTGTYIVGRGTVAVDGAWKFRTGDDVAWAAPGLDDAGWESVDVGRTWGSGVVGNSDPGLLKDVGFGLRLGNTRSGLGNVLHVDFAFPLSDVAGIQKFQFLVQTMQSF